MMVSRMLAPWPAQVVGGGVDDRTQRAHPAGLGGLQRVGQLLQLLADVVPLDRHRGAFARDHRVVVHHRPTGVGGRELDGARRHQRRRQDRGLGVGRHLVLAVVPERDLDPLGLRLDGLRSCRRARRGCERRRRGRCRCCSRSTRRHCVRLMVSVVRSSTTTPATNSATSADGQPDSGVAGHGLDLPWRERRHFARCGHVRPVLGVGSGVDCQPGRRLGGRSWRRSAGRRSGQRLAVGIAASRAGQRQAGRTAPLIAGVAGDGVGQRQMRFAALAGPRVGHRQRRRPRLADLRVGALRRQQHIAGRDRGRRTRRR